MNILTNLLPKDIEKLIGRKIELSNFEGNPFDSEYQFAFGGWTHDIELRNKIIGEYSLNWIHPTDEKGMRKHSNRIIKERKDDDRIIYVEPYGSTYFFKEVKIIGGEA